MSRIAKLPPEDWDSRIRNAVKPDEATDLEQGLIRYFAHCPEQALGLMQFGGAQEATNLSDAEKAAIRYGELMATDHLAIDDNVHAGLREHFSEAQIVELGMTCAFFVGFGRLAATYHMVDELPEAFRKAETIAPWGAEKIQVR